MELKFRDLTADDIEVRIQSFKEGKGAVLLLYKDARVDQNILDETVGQMNWSREHYECKGNLFCRVGIRYDNSGEWTYKADCGTESNTEAQKGEASDSFKRACFNWGIGRELYTSPFIWVKAEDMKSKYDKFFVEKIKIENKQVVGLAVKNETTGKRVFVWQKSTT